MKFIIEKQKLNGALAKIQPLVLRRGVADHLRYVCLEACPTQFDLIWVRGTNSKTHLEIEAAGTPVQAGGVAVPLKDIIDILRGIPRKALLSISWENREFRIEADDIPPTTLENCRDIEQFPKMPNIEASAMHFLTDKKMFVEALTRTEFAADAAEDSILHGIFICPAADKKSAAIIGTDQKTLSSTEILIDSRSDTTIQDVGIPLEEIPHLRKAFYTQGTLSARMGAEGHFIEFTDTHKSVCVQTLPGDVPNFDVLFPTVFELSVEVGRENLIEKTRKISRILPVRRLGTVCMSAWISQITISVPDGSSKLSVCIDSAESFLAYPDDPPDIELHVDVHRLLKIAEQMSGDTIKIRFTTPTGPILMVDLDEAHMEYPGMDHQCILMPIRVNKP